MRKLILAVILLVSEIALGQTTKPVTNISFGPSKQYRGYFVRGKGTRLPGLVMVHEWWGLNNNIRSEAKAYGARGYNVLAVDLFGKTTSDPQEATKLVQGMNQQAATAQLLAAAQYLRTLKTSSGRVGTIGWCFGGGQSLVLALNDPKLKAAAIYYGTPVVTDVARLRKIKAPMILFYGLEDQSIPPAKSREFDRALTRAGVPHEIHFYPGAGHAFANPTRSETYRPAAAADANRRAIAFLAKHLKMQRTIK